MEKVRRIALIFAAAIAGLAATMLLAVNLYVQSHATQERIQKELSQRLGTQLRIQRISVTPWWGLKLTGITIPQADPSLGHAFLKADTFRLRIRFASLFTGRLVIKEVSLVKPKVVWAQNAAGKWRIPPTAAIAEAPAAAPPEVTSVPIAPESVPAAPPAVSAPAEPVPPEAAPAEPLDDPARPFTPEVRRVNLADGSFRFLDVNGKPVATFEGVNFRSSFRNATALRGDASIAKTSLRNRFFLEQLETPLKYDPVELELSQITARAGGGEITGRFNMRPGETNSPFDVLVKFRDVQADRIVSDAGGPEGMVQGRLEGFLDANGNTADPNALAGTGEIHLHDGQVRQYSLLVALAQLLQIDELRQLSFDEAHVKYHIEPAVVTIDELLLSSANIRLTATGTISFSGRLRLESQLAINEKIRGQLFRPIRDNFQPIEQPGYAAVPFQVTGTIDRPKTDLMDKLVGSELKDLSGIISSFLGGGKSERPKKKKSPGPSPAAATESESAVEGAAASEQAVAPGEGAQGERPSPPKEAAVSDEPAPTLAPAASPAPTSSP